MAQDDSVTIRVSKETWRELNSCKHEPSDSFDDVLQELLAEAYGEDSEGNPKATIAD